MIWSTTTHIGMAFAISSSGATYVVARYSPPGNILGESPQQETTRGRRNNNTPANTSSRYGRPEMFPPFSNSQPRDSPYGQQRHRRPQPSYAGQRPYGGNIAISNNNNHNNNYARSSPNPWGPGQPPGGHRPSYQAGSRPYASSRYAPPSHPGPRGNRYGSPYLYGLPGPGPYGVGAAGSYASAVPPRGYGGYRSSDGGGKSLCCAVM
jgi:hypothetical protein